MKLVRKAKSFAAGSGLSSPAVGRAVVGPMDSHELIRHKPPALEANRAKQIPGDRLYPLINMKHPNLAGRINGMLLEGLPQVDLHGTLQCN